MRRGCETRVDGGHGLDGLHHGPTDQVGEADFAGRPRSCELVVEDEPVDFQQLGRDDPETGGGRDLQTGGHVGNDPAALPRSGTLSPPAQPGRRRGRRCLWCPRRDSGRRRGVARAAPRRNLGAGAGGALGAGAHGATARRGRGLPGAVGEAALPSPAGAAAPLPYRSACPGAFYGGIGAVGRQQRAGQVGARPACSRRRTRASSRSRSGIPAELLEHVVYNHALAPKLSESAVGELSFWHGNSSLRRNCPGTPPVWAHARQAQVSRATRHSGARLCQPGAQVSFRRERLMYVRGKADICRVIPLLPSYP